jgi:mRNA interferase MazF
MTRPMGTSEHYAPYDVVVLPFPYTDRLAEKRRPGLVVSSDPLATFGLVWVAMITSAANRGWSCDVAIPDLELAGLPAPSVVRPAKIACIEPSRILRRAGMLDVKAARRVAAHLRSFVADVPARRRT